MTFVNASSASAVAHYRPAWILIAAWATQAFARRFVPSMSFAMSGLMLIQCCALFAILAILLSCGDAKAQVSGNAQAAVVRLDTPSSSIKSYAAPLDVATGLDAALTVQDVASLPRERFTVQSSRDGASIRSNVGGAAVRFQIVYIVRR